MFAGDHSYRIRGFLLLLILGQLLIKDWSSVLRALNHLFLGIGQNLGNCGDVHRYRLGRSCSKPLWLGKIDSSSLSIFLIGSRSLPSVAATANIIIICCKDGSWAPRQRRRPCFIILGCRVKLIFLGTAYFVTTFLCVVEHDWMSWRLLYLWNIHAVNGYRLHSSIKAI